MMAEFSLEKRLCAGAGEAGNRVGWGVSTGTSLRPREERKAGTLGRFWTASGGRERIAEI